MRTPFCCDTLVHCAMILLCWTVQRFVHYNSLFSNFKAACLRYLGACLRGRTTKHASQKGSGNQRTPWGGGKKRGVENLTNDTPPQRGFEPPLVRYVFHPPQVSVLCFACTIIHDRANQKLFWRGPKIFGRARSLVRFPPPIRFAPPHIKAQGKGVLRF